MTAEQSKGLEFDAVVLVEPSAIAGSDITGLRQLYIALTRTTKFLALVHSEQFALLDLQGGDTPALESSTSEPVMSTPAAVATESSTPLRHPVSPNGSIRERTIKLTAQMLADEVRGTLGPDAFEAVVRALAEELAVPLIGGQPDQLF